MYHINMRALSLTNRLVQTAFAGVSMVYVTLGLAHKPNKVSSTMKSVCHSPCHNRVFDPHLIKEEMKSHENVYCKVM